jgi:hypothetical protein
VTVSLVGDTRDTGVRRLAAPSRSEPAPPPSFFVVETDKSTYLPSQKVQFRAVALGKSGKVLPRA